jgi:hypothetical protein
MAVRDFDEQEEQVRETREFRRSGRSEEREPRKKRIPLAIRILVWLGLLGIFFGAGYFVAGAGLRFLNKLGVGAPNNVLASSEEAQRFMASSQEDITVYRKEYAAYVLENGALVRRILQIAPGVIEEDIVTVLENVLAPLRVASGTQQPLRVLHVFRAGDVLYIDMNAAFVSALKAVGYENAALIMTGLMRSMVENFSPAEQVLFFVDGKLSKVTEPLDLTVPWTLAPAS